MKKIAIQGVKGCFHEQAARLFYQGHGIMDPEVVECLTFDGLYRSLDEERADYIKRVEVVKLEVEKDEEDA